ncbi:unnamed protein product [Phytophthora fragariaefolia]|uniref:Unnamed protein product n=1 Tax=Phytophthora fragariaefolia TaxID=1490495 RepID=A0A9W6XRP8_9STRA|nr:unnamed protein product [Phytophthora fragariaefolia]
MAQRRGHTAERPSLNPRPRQQSRTNAPDDSEASRPASRSRSRAPMSQGPESANTQADSTAQANERFEFLVASRGEQKEKDPPVYEGGFGEDIELWIFATEQYYAKKRHLMEAVT